MKPIKKTSTRLQKKLAAKSEKMQPQPTTSVIMPILANTTAIPIEQKKILVANILEAAKQDNPAVFENINNKQSLDIAKSIFQALNAQINELESGIIILPSFGKFVIKQIANQKNGLPNINRRIFCQIQNIKKPLQ